MKYFSKELLFCPNGEITRKEWWITKILVFLVIMFGFGFIIHLISLLSLTLAKVLVVIAYALLIWMNVMVDIKRWHNRNKSGWWELIILIPVIGIIWIIVELGFLAKPKQASSI